LEGGLEVVPVLIGAFGIPQIIGVLKDRFVPTEAKRFQRILPEFGRLRDISPPSCGLR
jgi:putative tricarboxylic transport membrane protein